jgi:pimeloyl-ACP methyl ester carboxylesterase
MLKKILIGISILIFLLAAVFLTWASDGASPMPEADQAMQSTSTVQVETDPWLIFTPAGQESTTGLILYPGGKVDPRSYAPLGKAIAEQGYRVVIVPMPLNLAVLAPGKAAEVIEAFPSIEVWGIGGHSLGGSMAANFARKHLDLIAGLVLWASYPASSDDLSQSGLKVVSIYGTQDGLSDSGKIEASKVLLPKDTRYIAIEGGNHAGFGWYGAQSGDGEATISRQEQQAQILQSTLELLKEISLKK